jgi:hypothetical protein
VQATEDSVIAREGYVALTLMPRAETGFDKTKKISVKLRARQIGQFIAWRINGGKSIVPPLAMTCYAGAVPVAFDLKPAPAGDDDEPMMQLTLTPKPGADGAEPAAPVSVPIPVGEVKALQVLMEASLPNLYGWTSKSLGHRKVIPGTTGTAKSPEDFFKQFSSSG